MVDQMLHTRCSLESKDMQRSCSIENNKQV